MGTEGVACSRVHAGPWESGRGDLDTHTGLAKFPKLIIRSYSNHTSAQLSVFYQA